MSSSDHGAFAANVNAAIDAIPTRRLPAAANLVSLALVALGVVAFLVGLFALGDGGAVAWGAFLIGLFWTLALTQGGILFSVMMVGTWGRWGRPLKRIGEAFGVFLPVVWVLMLVFLIFGLKIYAWNPDTILPGGPVSLEPHSAAAWRSKPLWLTPGFFIVRQLGAVAVLGVLQAVFLRAALRPDLVLATQRLGDRAPGWWRTITGGRTDVVDVLRSDMKTQSFLVPILGVGYAFLMTFAAFDLLMSLSPWWYANMFGGWAFASAFWTTLAGLGFVAMLSRDWLGLGRFVRPNVTHDLGKLMLAGTMLWAYTAFAQLLPIWYTDMPEETDYLLVRLYLPEWSWLAQTVGVSCFVAPFTILMSRGIKKMRWPFAGICGLILVGSFFEKSLLVLPSIHFGDPRTPLVAFVVVGTWLGFVGLFAQVVGRFLASVPAVVVSDPHLETHPWDIHAHSLDHAHH